ncbi:MAG TPA: hypothetical protein VHG08_15485 [Longimicrobium sp.]|nr:hypothetical protein [Longimicrobium sp.]
MRFTPFCHLRALPLAAVLLAALLGAACKDASGPGGRGRPGITVLDQIASDSVGARGGTLRLEVRDSSGAPAEGVMVEVVALTAPSPCPPCETWSTLYVGTGEQGPWNPAMTLAAGAGGALTLHVLLGWVAGEGGLVVRVPSLGYADTVRVTVHPGAAVGMRVAPADTAVAIGGSYTLRAAAVDRHGNARPDPVTLTTASSDLSLQGATVRGVSFGRAEIRTASGAHTGQAFVSVVPGGTVAAMRLPPAGPRQTVLTGLDGSNLHTLPSAPNGVVEDWNRQGTQLLVLYDELDQPDRISVYDMAAGTSRVVVDVTGHPRLRHLSSPRFAPDGEWIYFSGYESGAGWPLLWRIRPDGTGLELLTPPGAYVAADQPAVSPDGTRVVYVGSRASGDYTSLYVLDLASGTHTKLHTEGVARPRWSPTGEWISFTGSHEYRPFLVRPDGGGARELVLAPLPPIAYRAVWSPDGRWLLATSRDLWVVIDVATGEPVRLPQRMTELLRDPVWRP